MTHCLKNKGVEGAALQCFSSFLHSLGKRVVLCVRVTVIPIGMWSAMVDHPLTYAVQYFYVLPCPAGLGGWVGLPPVR